MKRGFTVVELVVVIVVIAILASIVAVSYSNHLVETNDNARRASVQQIEQAVSQLRLRRDSIIMMGGYYPSGAAPDSDGFCVYNGTYTNTSSTGSNWVNYSSTSSNYRCTLGSMLIATKVVASDFFDDIPENKEYTTEARKKDAAMVYYRCDTTNTRWILYYYLEKPTAEETASIDSFTAGCPSISTTLVNNLKSNLKMKAAIDIKLN